MIDNPQNSIEELENDVAGQIMQVTLFQGIKMPDGTDWQALTEDEGDVEFMFEKMISQAGLSIIVQSAIGEVTQPDIPGPIFGNLEFAVSVSECVEFNRSAVGTNIRLHKALAAVLGTLHGFVPSSIGTPIYVSRIIKDRDTHPETGALVTSKICLFKIPLAQVVITT